MNTREEPESKRGWATSKWVNGDESRSLIFDISLTSFPCTVIFLLLLCSRFKITRKVCDYLHKDFNSAFINLSNFKSNETLENVEPSDF